MKKMSTLAIIALAIVCVTANAYACGAKCQAPVKPVVKKVDNVEKTVTEKVESPKETAQNATETTQDKVQELYDASKETAQNVEEQALESIDKG
jgi:hypothetical protein